MEVIFNFAHYDELKHSVMQLLHENMDTDLLYEEAHDLFETWWQSNNHQGVLNEEAKQRLWQSLTQEFKTRTS